VGFFIDLNTDDRGLKSKNQRLLRVNMPPRTGLHVLPEAVGTPFNS